jgi:hypothetical protein
MTVATAARLRPPTNRPATNRPATNRPTTDPVEMVERGTDRAGVAFLDDRTRFTVRDVTDAGWP